MTALTHDPATRPQTPVEDPTPTKTSAPAAEPMTAAPPVLTRIETDAEVAGRFVANVLSRWHVNGWLLVLTAVVANVLGALTRI